MEIYFINLYPVTENLANDKIMTGCVRQNIETASLLAAVSHGEIFGVNKKTKKKPQITVF